MEGHALAEEVDIELLADDAFNFLGDDLKAKITGELEETSEDLRKSNDQGIASDDGE